MSQMQKYFNFFSLDQNSSSQLNLSINIYFNYISFFLIESYGIYLFNQFAIILFRHQLRSNIEYSSEQNNTSIMVWHFDFCAGFMPNDLSFNTNRYLIYGLLATHVLIFSLLKIIASCTFKGRAVISDDHQRDQGETTTQKIKGFDRNREDISEKISEPNHEKLGSNDSTFNNSTPPGSSELVSRKKNVKGRCLKFFENIDIDELERMFSIYFGHHAVCVGVCLMYCPYFPVTLICLVYLFLGLLLFFFIHSKYRKPIPWFWGLACFLNLALFFGSATFVGLANYDTETNQCYASIIEL